MTEAASRPQIIGSSCDRCGAAAPRNFLELWNPVIGERRTYYFCGRCQSEVCDMIRRWTDADL